MGWEYAGRAEKNERRNGRKVKVVKIMIYSFADIFIPHSAQLIHINIDYKKLDIFLASE